MAGKEEYGGVGKCYFFETAIPAGRALYPKTVFKYRDIEQAQLNDRLFHLGRSKVFQQKPRWCRVCDSAKKRRKEG